MTYTLPYETCLRLRDLGAWEGRAWQEGDRKYLRLGNRDPYVTSLFDREWDASDRTLPLVPTLTDLLKAVQHQLIAASPVDEDYIQWIRLETSGDDWVCVALRRRENDWFSFTSFTYSAPEPEDAVAACLIAVLEWRRERRAEMGEGGEDRDG